MKLSPAPDLPFVHPTVVHMLADAASRAPELPALVCGNERLTYSEYLRCVAGLARELVAAGVRGGRVAILMGNSIDTAIAIFAAHAAGAQVVPLNPAYTPSELGPVLADAAPRVIICDHGLRTRPRAQRRQSRGTDRIRAAGSTSPAGRIRQVSSFRRRSPPRMLPPPCNTPAERPDEPRAWTSPTAPSR